MKPELREALANLDISRLAPADRERILHLLQRRRQVIAENSALFFAPYAKQLSFFAAGRTYRERLLMAGNQLGKTMAGGFEVAAHATGVYPQWWPGRRYEAPTRGWVSGVTGESTRDNPQRVLLGPVGSWGTGMIPKSRIKKIVKAAHGVSDLVDMVFVEHVSGGTSVIAFKSYEKGREKWQGETLDYVWFDEEPPLEIYSEGLTRTQAVGGFAIVTFTPLLGMSNTVKRFIVDKTPGTHVTSMTIYDVEHYTDEERAVIIAGYPPHERDARANGIPILGSGRIFPVEELTIKEGRIEIPNHWPRIAGIDFGWTHPTAVLWAAWDRDTDTVHIYDEHRASQTMTLVHAHAIKSRGDWIPVAWPHDGENGTAQGEGISLASQYRSHGVRMLPERAQFPDGSISTEAANMALLNRMMTGRLKVAGHLQGWWEEFRLYHRKDGKIVRVNDDLMSAMHKIEMSLRYADVPPALMPWNTMPMGSPMLDAEVGF